MRAIDISMSFMGRYRWGLSISIEFPARNLLAVFPLKPKTYPLSLSLSNVIVSISYLILSIETKKLERDRPSRSKVILTD